MAHEEPSLDKHGEELAFLGTNARQAFVAAGGTNERFSLSGTPIATTGRRGSFGVHWDETRMTVELMTPFHNGGQENPFSEISWKSMADLGWTLKTGFTADAYALPTLDDDTEASADRGPVIDLRNDFYWTPIGTIGRNGERGDPIIPSDQINSAENQRVRVMVERVMQNVTRVMQLDDPFDDNENDNR